MEIEILKIYNGFVVSVYRPRKGCVLTIRGDTIEDIENIVNEEVRIRSEKISNIPKSFKMEYEEGLKNYRFLKGYFYYDFDVSHIRQLES